MIDQQDDNFVSTAFSADPSCATANIDNRQKGTPENFGDNNDDKDDDGSINSVTFFDTIKGIFATGDEVVPDTLDSFSAAFVLINFISIGYILNPSAFAQGGLLLGALGMAFVSSQSMITGIFLLEACTRAEMMKVSMSPGSFYKYSRTQSKQGSFFNPMGSFSLRDFSQRLSITNHSVRKSSDHNPPGNVNVIQEEESDQENSIQSFTINDFSRKPVNSPLKTASGHNNSISILNTPSAHNRLGYNHHDDADDSSSGSEFGGDEHTDDPPVKKSLPPLNESTPIQPANPEPPRHQTQRRIVGRASMINRRYLPHRHSLRIHQRTFEISELSRIFLGRALRNLFTFTTAGDLYGITWAFAAVFGSSLAEHLPLGLDGDWDYRVYIFIFMGITSTLSCMSISFQLPVQLTFLFARTIMLFLMLGTLYGAYASDTPHFGTQTSAARETPLANWSKTVTVFMTAIFSTAYQFAVPGLSGETGDKSGMVSIIFRSVGYIYLTNIILSLLMATYFGSATESSANLNWIDYHGGTWNGEGEMTRAWWAKGISSYIVLFAALDGLAVYPLIAISLGDILMGATFEDEVHAMQEYWYIRIPFRLLASIPQAVGSLFLKDLGVIAKYAGIMTLMSYTICPSYLAIQSRKQVLAAGLTEKTKYSTIFSKKDIAAWLLITLGIALICAVIADEIWGFSSDDDGTTGDDSSSSSSSSSTGDVDIVLDGQSTEIRTEAAEGLFSDEFVSDP